MTVSMAYNRNVHRVRPTGDSLQANWIGRASCVPEQLQTPSTIGTGSTFEAIVSGKVGAD